MLQIEEPKILGIYVSRTLFERLDAVAQAEQRSKSQVARQILERALQEKQEL